MQRTILVFVFGGLLGVSGLPPEAFAQAPAGVTITVHKGQCSTFNVGDKEYGCPKILHNYYPKTAMHSFTLDIPDGLLSMSGHRTNFTSPSSFTFQVDAVTVLQDDGKDTKKHNGNGGCSAKFSDDRGKLEELKCDVQFKTTKVAVQFTGDGEDGLELKSQSLLEGVDEFYKVYREIGIQGVVPHVQDCYKKIKYGHDIDPLAHCFAMDYVAYMIDSGFSGLFGTANNKYTSPDKMIERAKSNLKKFGYDQKAAERQIVSWVGKIKDWMRESGRL